MDSVIQCVIFLLKQFCSENCCLPEHDSFGSWATPLIVMHTCDKMGSWSLEDPPSSGSRNGSWDEEAKASLSQSVAPGHVIHQPRALPRPSAETQCRDTRHGAKTRACGMAVLPAPNYSAKAAALPCCPPNDARTRDLVTALWGHSLFQGKGWGGVRARPGSCCFILLTWLRCAASCPNTVQIRNWPRSPSEIPVLPGFLPAPSCLGFSQVPIGELFPGARIGCQL